LPAAGEDLNLDHEDEDPEAEEDEVPDVMNEDPTDPMNVDGSNMEFGKTPGGVDNTVTVNNSGTPPNVPGGTPVGEPAVSNMEQNLFDDAAETRGVPVGPQRIEKLG
jgi:hypothetical protein